MDFSKLVKLTIPEGVVSRILIDNQPVWEYATPHLTYSPINDDTEWAVTGLTKDVSHVTIPSSIDNKPVTTIRPRAFQNKLFSSITLPNSITNINGGAFDHCINLTRIVIPASVTSLMTSSFSGCYSLVEVINKSSEIINTDSDLCKYALSIANRDDTYQSKLQNENGFITYTEGSDKILIKYLGADSEVYIPESITKIHRNAFHINVWPTNSNSPEKIEIPTSVTSIGDHAFENCCSLTSIEIPNSITRIGGSAFRGCYNLKSVTLPFIGRSRTPTSADTYQYPFGDLFGSTLQYATSEAENALSRVTQYYYNLSTNSITSSEFRIPSSLESVTITDGDIPYGAFYNCINLKSITLPDSVTSIGGSAFYNCRFTSITLPNSVTSIGDSAFSGNEYLTNIAIPYDVESIGSSAFYNCSSLTSIEIPDSVTSIGERAFYYCDSLTNVTFGEGCMSHIGAYAFTFCTSLTSITIPYYVESIGSNVFLGCSSLKEINYLGSSGRWCRITSDNVIPSSESTPTLKVLKSFSEVEPKAIESVYASNYSDGGDATTIPAYAFYKQTTIISAELSDGITSIGKNAFAGCTALVNVTISNTVESIGEYAFNGCSNLSEINYTGSKEAWRGVDRADGWAGGLWPNACVKCSDGKEALTSADKGI